MEKDNIREQLDRIESTLQKLEERPGKFEKITKVLQGIIIPLLVGYLAFVTGRASNRIADAQKRLAEVREVSRREEIQSAFELEVFELFLVDIKNSETRPQAISLIDLMSPSLAIKLKPWVSSGGGNLSEPEVASVRQSIDNRLLSVVNAYKIQIFYNSGKPQQQSIANEIKDALTNANVTSPIEIKQRGGSLDAASYDQIRYFEQNEREVAEALQNILENSYTELDFGLQPVYTASPGSISIFLKN